MNRFIVVLFMALGFFLPRPAALADNTRHEQEAKTAAAEWLALVDAGKHVESREAMSPGFKKKISKRKWKSTMNEIRAPLGKVASRQLKSAHYSKDLPGAPEGEYVVLQYDSVFERKPAATEKVTLTLGQDLIWRVSGYAVK